MRQRLNFLSLTRYKNARRYLSVLQGPDQILPALEHRSWLPDQPVKLNIPESGLASGKPISIPSLFRNNVEKIPDNLALGTRDKSHNLITWTYHKYYQDVLTVSKGFIALGLEPYHSVCILGQNSPEWSMSSLAAVHSSGFASGIYQTNTIEACKYVAEHSRANIIVVDDNHQLQKILAIKDQLPNLRAIIQYKPDTKPSEPGVLTWNQLIELGKSESSSELDKRLSMIGVNQCALLCYTSGTTGNPKGAMISHDAVTQNSSVTPIQMYNWRFGKERLVSYLPMSHVAASVMDIYWAMGVGATTYFADENALKGSLVDNLKIYKPTRFLGVPRVWEKIEEKMKLAGQQNTGVKKKVADWAKSHALKYHLNLNDGIDKPTWQYKLAKKLVLSKVPGALGMEEIVCMEMATGAAVTSQQTAKFFLSLDIRLFELYGSTESTGTPTATHWPGPGNSRIGTIGRQPKDFLESKLLDVREDGVGEICSRGRTMFMGYLYDKEKTLQTIDDDGWVHSGDLCTQDSDGFFKMVGRTKEIIVTTGGENIAPTNIENEIKKSLPNLISNVMVVGDSKKFLSCLITLKVKPDPQTMQPTNELDEQVLKVLESLSIPLVKTVHQLVSSKDVNKLNEYIGEGIKQANIQAISNAAKVQKWRILEDDFSVGTGEFGPSLKLKRFFVIDKYKNIIDDMYVD